MKKRIVKIYFEGEAHKWNRGVDRKLWTGVFADGIEEAYDYGTKESLMQDIEKDGYDWEVYKLDKKLKKRVLVKKSY